MIARRGIALLCLLSSLGSSLAPMAARAEDNQSTLDGILEAGPVLSFEERVSRFIDLFGLDSAGRLATGELERLSDGIRSRVFADAYSADYLEKLRHLDGLSTRHPKPIEYLAKTLQEHWAADYGMGFNASLPQPAPGDPHLSLRERRALRIRAGDSAGTLAGVVLGALSFALTRNPAAARSYFSVFRLMAQRGARYYVGGFAAGHGVGTALGSPGLLGRNLPVAPALVMRLGMSEDELLVDEKSVVAELIPLMVGISATPSVLRSIAAAARALRVAGTSAAAAELEFPPAAVASIVIPVLIEAAIARGTDAWEYGSLESALSRAVKALDRAIAAGDDQGISRASDRLVRKAVALHAYVNDPIVRAGQAYLEALASAERLPRDGAPYLAATERALRRLDDDLREAFAGQDQSADTDYHAYLAIKTLEAEGIDALSSCRQAISGLPDPTRERARTYLDAYAGYHRGFEAYVDRAERLRAQSLGSEAREKALGAHFVDYLGILKQGKNRQLAQALRDGRIERHPGHVLLQAAALLYTTGQSYAQARGDTLMSLLADSERSLRYAALGVLD